MASIRQISGQVSRGSAGEYQSDELQYCFCFMIARFFGHKACGILALQPGTELAFPFMQ